MPGIGDATLMELLRLWASASGLVLQSILIVNARLDLRTLDARERANGRRIQLRSNLTTFWCILLVHGIFAVITANSLRQPPNPLLSHVDLLLAGIGFVIIQFTLAWLSLHWYLTRAKLLGGVIRWPPRFR